MRTLSIRTLRTALAGCAGGLLIGTASLSYADDTEIFFGGPSIDSGVRPNVLFILDNSGSMNWRTASNDAPGSGEESRLKILKDSFASIIGSAGAINAGVMVLNTSAESSSHKNPTRMLHPVSYLNAPVAAEIASTPEILASSDDAGQVSGAPTAVIDAPTLSMGKFQAASSTTDHTLTTLHAFRQNSHSACLLDSTLASPRSSDTECDSPDSDQVGLKNSGGTALLYFSGLGIPAGATVTTATLTVYPTNTRDDFDPRVAVERSKIALVPNDDTSIAARTFSAWRDLPDTSWSAGTPVSLNVTSEINDLRSLSYASAEVDNLLLKLTGDHSNARFICMRTGSTCAADQRPVLSISYSLATPIDEERTAALRFQNVGIPQGATITEAYLSFAPAVPNSVPVTLSVTAQDADGADAFTNTGAGKPSARTSRTAASTWTESGGWSVSNPPTHIKGPDVQDLVQTVVNRSGWCGNNSMAFFIEHTSGAGLLKAYSFDGAPGLQPTLTVKYSGGSTGCLNPIFEIGVTDPNNDAAQDRWGNMRLDSAILPIDRSHFAARFTAMPLKNAAVIMDAKLILIPNNTQAISTPVTATLSFQAADNAAPFTSAKNNISSRSQTATSTCSISTWKEGIPVTCTNDLTAQLQSVVGRPGWAANNALALISTQTTDSELDVRAYESNITQSVKLRIKVGHGGLADSSYTVRQHLNALVQTMAASSGTPIVPTYLEAAKYLRGELPGKASPITSACQPTHIVLLTDGQASGNGAASEIASLAGSCSVALVTGGLDPGIADTGTTSSSEQCGRKLGEWLTQTDHSALEGKSVINTHTIGFALDALLPSTAAKIFMADIADNGNGGAYTAKTASDLNKAFGDIFASVQDVDATFVSASAPVNSFERQNNKDELYFSLFSPQKTHSWPGNLKRYRFAFTNTDGTLNPRIVDSLGHNAVNLETGNFSGTSRSYWSAENDGNDSGAGGAAAMLPAPGSRKLYTYASAVLPSHSVPATLSSHPLLTSNTSITNATLGVTTGTDSEKADERDALFNYIRGSVPERKFVGDPVHSSPRLATYSCITVNLGDPSKCDKDDQTAYIGTNEGFVQAFNTNTGEELFAFMPQQLLANIKKLKTNAATVSTGGVPNRPYGMDSPLTLWINDIGDGGTGLPDGKIFATPASPSPQTGEFVYAYATMGRGGKGLYALDVTHRTEPKLLWFIKGGETPGFAKLGDTWSTPVKTKIQVGTEITDVLIFAGGYDNAQDNVDVRTASNGGALYVVNAKTGALIWSASTEATNSDAAGHLQLSKMLYSMPATPRVIDLQTTSGTPVVDPNRLADQVFIGDMGGQVWRFYIRNGSSGAGLLTAGGASNDGVFASAIPSDYDSLAPLGQRQNLRRFYNEPDVALLNKNGTRSLSVNIGSGYRGHPLSKDATDRFYSFRSENLTDYAGSEGTITTSDLLDITNNLAPTTEEKLTLDLSDSRVKGGWYISLPAGSGEKVLTRALTAGAKNTVYFSTYEPAASTGSSCEPAYGTSRGYAVNLFDGTPAKVLGGGITPVAADRFGVLKVPGLPPQPELICIGNNCSVIKGPGDIDSIEMPKLGKMYWNDIDEGTL